MLVLLCRTFIIIISISTILVTIKSVDCSSVHPVIRTSKSSYM